MARNRSIPITVSPSMFTSIFEGFTPPRVLLELIKNADDWRVPGVALRIAIETRDRQRIVVVDNGQGMNQERQVAFVSGGQSTAGNKGQSGTFGTGVKHALFSLSQTMHVRTIDAALPREVVQFTLSREHWLPGSSVECTIVPRSDRTWPHNSASGTEITIELAEPNSRRILRGGKLAKRLLALLPNRFETILTVDDQSLPARKIIGESFEFAIDHPALGQVIFEVYRPEEPEPEESLRLGVSNIGEIPMDAFQRAIDLELPEIIRRPEVCGTVIVPAFKQYALQDRQSLKDSAKDDPRVKKFVDLLYKHAPEIQRRLKIQLGSSKAQTDHKQALDDTYNNLRRAFPQKGDVPEDETGLPREPRDREDEDKGDKYRPLVLHCGREYEVGEEITVKAEIHPEAGFKAAELEWQTDDSLGRNIRQVGGGLVFTAAHIGNGLIVASLPHKPITALCRYRVVKERQLRLHGQNFRIPVGRSFRIMALNADKGPEPLEWSLQGTGSLKPYAATAEFVSNQLGEATVTVYGRGHKHSDSCRIVVVPDQTDLIKIGRHWFKPTLWQGGERSPAIKMVSRAPYHALMINEQALDFAASAKAGILSDFLLSAIARAYTEFRHFEFEDFPELAAKTGEALQDSLSVEAAKILALMLAKREK